MAAEVSSALQDGSLRADPKVHALEAVGLRKAYGPWPVLWDLELTLGWGECLVVLGANGAGKTTLLKVLSTQARLDAGQVRIGGLDIRTHAAAARSMIGVVAHRHLLYEDLTADENLRFYGRMFGLADLKAHVQEVLQRVGLTERGDQKVRSLSNGLQKRLAIARAILHRPKILLLDEPESGLDSEALEVLGSLIGEWKEHGRSVVMTTHNLERGLEWGDRIAVLANGKIAFDESRWSLDAEGFAGAYRQLLGVAP